MIIHNPILTGSFTVNGTDVASITSSAASITAINSYTASQNILNGTYATTGSNTFAGIQTVNSNLVVTGSITASTLVVQTITSSVDFVTGSTRFGSILGNTHVFSGSITMNPGGLFVSSSGNVGIGTITPTDLLHLYKSGTVYQMIQTVSGGAGTVYRRSNSPTPDWTIGHGAASANENFEVYTAGTGSFIWTMNGADKMRITPTGTIGIGTSSAPVGNLNLWGGTAQYLVLTNTGADGVTSAIQGGIIGQARGYGNNLAQMASILFRNNPTTWYKGEITFNTNDSDGTNPAASTVERMRITSAGNVLIGTTTDNGYKLRVDGAISYSSGGLIQNLNDTVSANTTRTYTITGVLAGGIQIMVGAFGNGTGNSSRAFWVGGGYLDSALPYTEVLRVNTGTIVISTITSNTSSSVFTVTNNFGFNSAFVGITIISGGLIGNPTITAS
jgi:hypothetical protein